MIPSVQVGLIEEEFRLKRMKIIVDRAAAAFRWRDFSDGEAENLVANTRRQVLELFPGKGELFDLIFRPRFERIRRERINERRADWKEAG